jgi:hypothetical protein
MKRIRTISTLVVLGLFMTRVVSSEDNARLQRTTILRWVSELGHDRFETRRAATRKLIEAGASVIPFVYKAAEQSDLEASHRAVTVLLHLSMDGDSESIRRARVALSELASSENRFASRGARDAILRRQERFFGRLEALGASATVDDGRVVSISFAGKQLKDDDFAILAEFPDVERLDLYKSSIGDAGLVHLKGLTKLRRLPMGSTKVTDAGLVHLRDLKQLTYLGLRANNITDAGLVHLEKLINLTGLYLGETNVTDAGLIHIRHLTKMEQLRLDTMRVRPWLQTRPTHNAVKLSPQVAVLTTISSNEVYGTFCGLLKHVSQGFNEFREKRYHPRLVSCVVLSLPAGHKNLVLIPDNVFTSQLQNLRRTSQPRVTTQ